MLIKAVIFFTSLYISLGLGFDDIPHTGEGFKLGNEVLLESTETLKNKNVALLTNQTGILANGTHIIDELLDKKVNVVKIFSPEHGIRGDESYSTIDEKTGIPIVSLYGGKNKPSGDDLKNVDVIIYDIQDVGARFYTYTSTLYYLLESAIENQKTVIICDRPLIINPNYADGFMLEPGFESFVGLIPAPVCYGMTPGELAQYLCGYVFNNSAYLKVCQMQNYSRGTDYNSLNLPWVKPSPNIFTPASALCYPATCFLEGTNVSEGRGTAKPFEYFGAPWVSSELLANALNSYNLAGVVFEPVEFTPSEKISSYPPKFFNKQCSGICINVTDKYKFEAVKAGVAILIELNKNFPEFKFNRDNFIDKLAGSAKLRKMVSSGAGLESIINSWNEELAEFQTVRAKFLLYN
jgi:uncharacterized protein YbbC (DUF1343 family)